MHATHRQRRRHRCGVATVHSVIGHLQLPRTRHELRNSKGDENVSDWTITTAHCPCMAGQGEACSHVGAMLFAVETAVRVQDAGTRTNENNVCCQPSTSYPKQTPQRNRKVLSFSFSMLPPPENKESGEQHSLQHSYGRFRAK